MTCTEARGGAVLAFSTSDTLGDDLSPSQQLVDACYRLNQYRVVKLLRDGVDVNATFGMRQHSPHYDKDWTPLLALAMAPRVAADGDAQRQSTKRITILRVLISHNCDLNKRDSRGATALHFFIRNRDSECAKLLLVFNPDVNTWATREYGGRESPLHSAYWSPDLTATLLSHGANADVTDEYRLAAAKSDYYRSLAEFMKSMGRLPTDDEKKKLGFDPSFDDIMTPRERYIERLRAELEAGKSP